MSKTITEHELKDLVGSERGGIVRIRVVNRAPGLGNSRVGEVLSAVDGKVLATTRTTPGPETFPAYCIAEGICEERGWTIVVP